jgi:Helix-turn-helix domain
MKNPSLLSASNQLLSQNGGDRESQCRLILNHLKEWPITAMDALTLYKCFRLAARICDLKKEGYSIDKRMIETMTGEKVAQYFLIKNK